MQNAPSPSQSGQAVTELQLVIPDGETLSFSEEATLIKTTVTETVFGFSTCSHTIQTTSIDYVDRLLKKVYSHGNPKIRYRIGFGLPGNYYWQPWQEHFIVEFKALGRGLGAHAGHLTRINTADPLWSMGRFTKVAVRKGKISTVLKQIADENQLESVIESTQGEGIYIQSFQTDSHFISHKLIPRSTNDKGRGDYRLYVKDGALHFHTPDYQSTLKHLDYYAAAGSDLIQKNNSQEVFATGGSGMRLVTHDPYTGLSKEVVFNPNMTLKLGNTAVNLADIRGTVVNSFYHIGSNRHEETEAIVNNGYESMKSKAFEVYFKLPNALFLRASDFLNLTLNTSPEKTSTWSGIYHVSSVSHAIVNGAIKSSVTLHKGELQEMKTEDKVPGQLLNQRLMNDSERAVGAGNQGSEKIFTTTRPPDRL